jgi:hypothetical protein
MQDCTEKIGAGYIHAIMQGMKMGIIANQRHFKPINEKLFKDLPGRNLDVVLSVCSPDSLTTLGYLQSREKYPPNHVIKNFEGTAMAELYANSFEMRLRKKYVDDASGKQFVGWFWMVQTNHDQARKATYSVVDYSGLIRRGPARPAPLAETKSDESSDDDGRDPLDPSDSGDEGVSSTKIYPQKNDFYVQAMKKYNKMLNSNSSGLLSYDYKRIIFCTESNVVARVIS